MDKDYLMILMDMRTKLEDKAKEHWHPQVRMDHLDQTIRAFKKDVAGLSHSTPAPQTNPGKFRNN